MPVAESRPASGVPDLDLLETEGWQMIAGERAALEGVLSRLRPGLAIEIGTADGGSLRRLARHCGEVHSFDLRHGHELAQISNVELHTGDNHTLLPEVLAGFESAGRNVDFVLVDGDHSADGVHRDVEDLLYSNATRGTLILAHDACNEAVRAGLQRVNYVAHRKVIHVDLDFIAGHLSRAGPFENQLWGGFALIVVNEESGSGNPEIGRPDMHPTFEVLRHGRLRLVKLSGQSSQETASRPHPLGLAVVGFAARSRTRLVHWSSVTLRR